MGGQHRRSSRSFCFCLLIKVGVMKNKYILIPGLMIWILFSACKKDLVEQAGGTPIRPITPQSSKYVTTMFEYQPAPGQFINSDLGNNTGARSILKKSDGLVSLGAWGGYIVLGFDHTVMDRKDTADIMIYGNAISNGAEPGIVWVMQDDNGNGQPDDLWYELSGSEFNKAGYLRNYSVTYTRPDPATADIPWKDNQGNSGFVKTNTFHTQSYYPEWITAKEYTITGSLLPDSHIDDSNPSFIVSNSFPFGYADNTAGGNPVDIKNAIDKNNLPVKLKGIDFIKIQTGIQFNIGWLGEFSTEIMGVSDISMGL